MHLIFKISKITNGAGGKKRKNVRLVLLLPLQNCKCVDLWMSVKPTAASQGRETQRFLVFNAKDWPRKRAKDLLAPQLSEGSIDSSIPLNEPTATVA